MNRVQSSQNMYTSIKLKQYWEQQIIQYVLFVPSHLQYPRGASAAQAGITTTRVFHSVVVAFVEHSSNVATRYSVSSQLNRLIRTGMSLYFGALSLVRTWQVRVALDALFL